MATTRRDAARGNTKERLGKTIEKCWIANRINPQMNSACGRLWRIAIG